MNREQFSSFKAARNFWLRNFQKMVNNWQELAESGHHAFTVIHLLIELEDFDVVVVVSADVDLDVVLQDVLATLKALPSHTQRFLRRNLRKASKVIFSKGISDTVPCMFLLQGGSNTTTFTYHHFSTLHISRTRNYFPSLCVNVYKWFPLGAKCDPQGRTLPPWGKVIP
jgi:hypothetical protein